MYTLENENLIINSKSEGAELTRIYSKKYKKEIIGRRFSKCLIIVLFIKGGVLYERK